MGLFAKKTVNTITVVGMKCPHCASKVVDGLKNINVKAVVDLDNKTVEVSYDENKTSLDTIKNEINKLGFEAQ